MWGNHRPANRMGPFRGSQEERFAPGWNRDYSPPPLDSLAQERHSGNFSGRESLPFDIQGLPGIHNPQFANREEPSFSFGGRDGPRSDFRGEEGHLHDFGGRDYPPSDFQSRDDSHLDFRGRVPLLPDYRGREMYPGDFQDREGQSVDYSGGDIPPMDYRNREAFRMNYRDREAHGINYRGRDDAPSDFRSRGTFDLDFRNRDGSHPHFRARDISEQDYRGREQSYSDFRKRDIPDTDLRGMGSADLDFRDRDVPHSNFRNRPKSQADQDFRNRDVPPPLDFADREMPSADSDVVDFQNSQSTVPPADRECKIEEAVHVVGKRSSLGVPNEEFPQSEPRAREEESQGQNPEAEPSVEFQNSRGPLPTLQDQDKPPQAFVSTQDLATGEQQTPESSGLGLKEKSDLDFLGRQDTDYRGIEYRDVDHRLPGSQLFEYEHGKSFAEGKSSKDSQIDLQDQDYRTCLKDIKPSKLIRLGRVPETATKDDILNAFQTCDGTPVKNLRLKDYTTSYNYGYICVEFSLLEEAIACMEANQGTLMIGGKQVTLEYSQEFWHCKRCKLSTVGYRSSCYFCKLPRDVTEEKLEKGEEALSEEPAPEEELLKEPIPEQETAPQKPMSEQQCQPQEPEAKKKDDIREQWPSQERKRDFEMYSPRKENQERGSRKATEAKHQEDESKTIMLKRIPRFTPPEVIVGLLAPYVRLSTSSVRVMKNKAGRMGYTYGFIELDSHAEALRLVKVLQNLDPPISIDGRPVDVNLATGKRRNEYGDQGDNPRFSQGKRGMSDRRGGDSQKRKSESSSDVSTFIYDPDTGNYFDPISGVYYDPNTQREVPMGREASISPPPSSGRRHKSQERTSERDDTSSRDNRERRDRHRNKSAKNESQEEKFPAEDVFKKPLPPVLKKEESTPPPKVVNPLIGLLGEYGGDSDNEDEEDEEEPQPQPPRPPVQQQERPQKAENDEDKLTDWNKLACLLCRRQFPNKEVLIKHQQLSNLHKQNLEIHRKIKRSEQELAYLERREREGRFKEKGSDRRERFEERNSPERKRPKYFRNSESDYKPMDKGRMESNNKGSRMMQAMGWKEGSGLGRNEQGMTSPVEPENRKKGAGLGTQGRPSRRQSNETYRDAVRRVMFARYKELE
ncbi:RNA-binding protein 6 isoform X1 [Varanus komodoensis]|uniref:RNA-binding protein 6 isoform X1 n=1 Tax=Varanus komodoensis TaxID=61221 RepID=UPI001CF7753A|nr:RNA-binding protein 6 isoform X1 [Varanus komodoensis]XP_044307033.1 RNA-binding protein 6 isoform X1 [Varanus komodoensis]